MKIFMLAVSLLVASAAGQERCTLNRCLNNDECYNRNVAGEPNFVCECSIAGRMGHDCTTPSDNLVIKTSYGLDTGINTFESDKYPNNYDNRIRALYLLYIPGATQIQFSFDSPFAIEENKDELYVGAGLEFNVNQIDGQTSSTNPIDKYFFDGVVVPQPFSIFSDTAWVYFLTDKNNDDKVFSGWRLRWISPDIIPPIITRIDDIAREIQFGQGGTTVFWNEPTATDNSGTVTLASRTHSPGSFFSLGTTTVTYTYTDGAGNSASTSFDVIVSELGDATPPLITPIDDITVTIELGTATATSVSWTEPIATDDSGIVTLITKTRNPGSIFALGTTPVTYTFSDPSRNTASTTFNVNVVTVDTTPPVIGLVDDVTVTVIQGTANSARVTWTEPTASDISGTATLVSKTNSPNSLFRIGTTPVTYTFTDPSGNRATVTFNVNVVEVDGTGPVIEPVNDITVTVPLGSAGRTVTWTEPTATDDSGTATISDRTRSPNSFFPVGTTQVTYTFTDEAGNTASTTFNINVVEVDISAPIIASVDDITVTVPLGTPGRTVSWTEPTATDNSGIATLADKTRSPNSFFSVGATPVTYTFTDESGNTASITFNVNVVEVDISAPIITPVDDITVTVPLGMPGRTVSWTEPTATDDSGTATLTSRTRSPNAFFPVGTTQVTYTFTDEGGNAASTTFNVNVVEVDSNAPEITPLNDITVTVPLGIPGRTVDWIEPSATDDSGTATLTSRTNSPNSYFPVGSTPVTYTYTDPSGNTASVSFNVNVVEVDSNAPEITPLNDITVTVPLGIPGRTVDWIEPSATDDSGTATLSSRTNSPNSYFPVGTTPVTYTYTDPSGNTASVSFNVNVVEVDDTAPVVSCVDDVTQTVGLNIGSAMVSWIEPTATDNSGVVTLSSRSHTPGSLFSVGSSTVSYTFVDGSGNTATCSFTVSVVEVDDIAPVIVCLNDISETTPLGSGGRTVTWVAPTATDNSGVARITSVSNPPGSFFVPGSTTVTYRFVDGSGNSATCTFTVLVTEVDTVPPVINCIQDVVDTVEIGRSGTVVTWTEPTATDNSNLVNLVSRSRVPGTFFLVGSNPVTYRFVDGSGNDATCTFDVTIVEVDTTAPVIACNDAIVQSVELGTSGLTVSWTEPTATDNSGSASLYSKTRASGSFFNIGTESVTYVFSDLSGNAATCLFDVTVNAVDTVAPVPICSNGAEVTVALGTPGISVTWVVPIATDISDTAAIMSNNYNPGDFFPVGVTTVFYTFQDASGNTANCNWPVTVTAVDEVAPIVLGCPADILDTVSLGVSGKGITWIEPTSNDNSGRSSITSRSHAPGSYFLVGDTTVSYIFSDESSNTAECSFVVSITEVDNVAPVVSCPDNIALTVKTGKTATAIEFVEPTAVDDSGVAHMISRSHPSGAFFVLGSTTVTYRFTDITGNVGSCSFEVLVEDADPCFNLPCFNGGVCVVESLTEYSCVCPECYNGETCEIAADACAANLCNNGAECMTVAGTCTAYSCDCPDCFFGQYCTQRVNSCDNNQCANGAQCVPDPNDCTTYYCQCPACYQGQFCQNAADACMNNLCENGGQCMPTLNGACTEYTCSCSGCNTGQYCEISRTPCDRNPCGNNGVCFQLPASCTAYTCECQGCFTGFNCEFTISSPCLNNPCQNGGRCSVISGQCNAHSCICLQGFAGVNCQSITTVNVNPCSSFPCGNGGSCVTMDATYYVCLCMDGYAGINCQLNLETTGSFYDTCSQGKCSNGGTCFNSFHSSNNINGNFAPQYTCICGNGFSGIGCLEPIANSPELDICSVLGRPRCENGGVCYNTYHSYDNDVDYLCDCIVGFVGHNCETAYYNPCVSDPCLNGGQCTAFSNYFTCACATGYVGINCNIDTAIDNIPPVVSNVPNSMYVYTNNVGASVNWDEPTATDNTGTANLIRRTNAPGSFFPVGTTPVSYVYADSSNNVVSVVFFVTVLSSTTQQDAVPPVISNCPTGVSVTAAAGVSFAIVGWNIPTATDNSGALPTRTSTRNPGESFNIGTTPVSITFTDAAGNSALCRFVVTVTAGGVDTVPPTIFGCPTGVNLNAPVGSLLPVSWIPPTATDNSNATPNLQQSHAPGDRFPIGTTLVTYTFSDAAGNENSCSFGVVVSAIAQVDTVPPVISNCPTGVTVTAAAGASSAIVDWSMPTAIDNSDALPTRTSTRNPGESFNIGTTLVSTTFTDAAGNRAVCRFIVTVTADDSDTVAPTISGCLTGVNVNAPAGSSPAVSWIPPTATDNSGATPILEQSHAPGDRFTIGTTLVIYTFSDAAGNEDSCSFRVVVSATTVPVDSTPPVIFQCPAGVQVTALAGTNSAIAQWAEPTATDNSGVAPNVIANYRPGYAFPYGTTEVIYTFYDEAGNSAVCSFNVEIAAQPLDTTPPVINGCPAATSATSPDLSTSALISWVPPTATDNSGLLPILSSSHTPGDSFIVGTTVVSYVFRDSAGNEATCRFNVVVTVANSENPCASNPCRAGLACYYTLKQYICLPPGARKRRDADNMWILYK